MAKPASLKDKLTRASFTVEVCGIMPVVFLTIFGCLYLCFHVHNRAWLTCAAYEAALCGSIESANDKSLALPAARIRAEELISTGFFALEDLSSSVSGDKTITVTYSGNTKTGYGNMVWPLSVSGKSKVIDPVAWVRGIKSVKDIFIDIEE